MRTELKDFPEGIGVGAGAAFLFIALWKSI